MVDDAAIDATLKKLSQLIDDHKITIFDENEAIALKEVAAFWRGFRMAGRFIAWFRRPIKWIGYIGGAYVTFKSGGVADVLKGFFK